MFFIFCIIDQVTFTWKFVFLIYPIVMELIFNIGIGLILSALFVFFRDIQYLWTIFQQLLMYMSVIFYTIDSYPIEQQQLFKINPIYNFIHYFRSIVLYSQIPSLVDHLIIMGFAMLSVVIGCVIYKKYNARFLYYI